MMHRVAILMLLAAGAGCGGRPQPDNPARAEPAAVTPAPVPPVRPDNVVADKEEWGTIKGRVVWGGDGIPERKMIDVPTTHGDHQHCTSQGQLLSEDLVVNKTNKGIRWVFVWLVDESEWELWPPKDAEAAPAEAKKKLRIHPSLQEIKEREVFMDQPHCAFIPHCLAMREGQEVVVKNSAPVLHGVKWEGLRSNRPGGSVSVPAKGSYTLKGLKQDKLPVTIECNIHRWMTARVLILRHPYVAVTDENGAFEIKLAPAGSFHLRVWCEGIGWRNGPEGKYGDLINIKGGTTTDLGELSMK